MIFNVGDLFMARENKTTYLINIISYSDITKEYRYVAVNLNKKRSSVNNNGPDLLQKFYITKLNDKTFNKLKVMYGI